MSTLPLATMVGYTLAQRSDGHSNSVRIADIRVWRPWRSPEISRHRCRHRGLQDQADVVYNEAFVLLGPSVVANPTSSRAKENAIVKHGMSRAENLFGVGAAP